MEFLGRKRPTAMAYEASLDTNPSFMVLAEKAYEHVDAEY